MGDINWSLLKVPNIGQAFQQGYDGGRQRNALAAYAQNPDNGQALNALAEFQPEFVIKQKQLEAKYGTDQAEAQRKREAEMRQQSGRLLQAVKVDPSKYQQARAAAIQLGFPQESIPAQYDPVWVDNQLMLASAYEKDGGQQISGLARELQDAGYKPGTPQFTQAMGIALQGKYAPQYTDAQGNVRMGSLPALPQVGGSTPQASPQQAQEALTFGQFKAYADVQGLPKAAQWARQNGLTIRVTTPQEAEQLPSGARIILPDGSEGVVP